MSVVDRILSSEAAKLVAGGDRMFATVMNNNVICWFIFITFPHDSQTTQTLSHKRIGTIFRKTCVSPFRNFFLGKSFYFSLALLSAITHFDEFLRTQGKNTKNKKNDSGKWRFVRWMYDRVCVFVIPNGNLPTLGKPFFPLAFFFFLLLIPWQSQPASLSIMGTQVSN